MRVSFLRLFKWNADARGNEDVPTPAASAHDGVGRLTPSLTEKAEAFFSLIRQIRVLSHIQLDKYFINLLDANRNVIANKSRIRSAHNVPS